MSIEVQQQVRRRRSGAEWQRVIAAQAASPLGQLAYCRRHGIAYSSFCRWKRELSHAAPALPVAVHAAFVELEPAAPAVTPHCDAELGRGRDQNGGSVGGVGSRDRSGGCRWDGSCDEAARNSGARTLR